MKDIRQALQQASSPERKEQSEKFFKTGKGDYSEHDIFIGVRNPDIRKIARDYSHSSLSEIKDLLYSEIHEERLLALVLLVDSVKSGQRSVKDVADFYLDHLDQVNNWDLVDASAHYILGRYVLDYPQEAYILDDLADSESLWRRRVAMVATWLMIREGEIDTSLGIAKKLLGDGHDLIHKAVGWMLREAWKKDPKKIEDFLIKNYKNISRTSLRYAIERMNETKRKQFLSGSIRA